MWSNLPPSNNPAGHISLLTGSLASFAAKHRFLFIVLVTILTLALIAGLFILQSAAASQKVQQQTVSNEQQTSVSATALPAAPQEYTVATDEQAPTQPTQTQASVSQSGNGTTVQINNETIQLPENGAVQRTIQNDTGATQIQVSTHSDSSGSNTSLNSTSVNMNNSSMSNQSSISINNSQ